MRNGLPCNSLVYTCLLTVFLLGNLPPGWGASTISLGELDAQGNIYPRQTVQAWTSQRNPNFDGAHLEATVKEVAAYDFDSYDALMEWLEEQEVIADPLELEFLLEQLTQEEFSTVQSCLSAQARPARIDVTKPFRFKLIQLSFPTFVGNCGLVICGRIQFSLEWFVAPTGGALFIGPTPKATREEVCVGDTVSVSAFLILMGSIQPGAYSLTFRASSDAFGDAVAGVELLVR
jgi:hypothetical protein